VATAKQAGKPATNNAKKTVGKSDTKASGSAGKPVAKPAAASAVKNPPAKAVTAAGADAKSARSKAAAVKTVEAKPAPAKPKAAVKAAQVKASAPKSAPPPAKAVPQAKAKTAVKQAAPTPAPAPTKPAARQVTASPPAKPMKTSEPKTSAEKSGKSPRKAVGAPLTDADVLAMSDKDYMNDAQLAFFKAKLEAMRDEILENARETGEHLKENEVFADPNDRATVEEENLLEQRVRDRERKLLKKINASLTRIEEGSYGYCLETGDPIGIPRLLARPTAELSIEAQEKHERLEKLYAD